MWFSIITASGSRCWRRASSPTSINVPSTGEAPKGGGEGLGDGLGDGEGLALGLGVGLGDEPEPPGVSTRAKRTTPTTITAPIAAMINRARGLAKLLVIAPILCLQRWALLEVTHSLLYERALQASSAAAQGSPASDLRPYNFSQKAFRCGRVIRHSENLYQHDTWQEQLQTKERPHSSGAIRLRDSRGGDCLRRRTGRGPCR